MAIDIGTTHCKVGLFNSNGFPLKIVYRPMHTQYSAVGGSYFDPDELIGSIKDLILEVLSAATDKVDAVGITSMAESGVLADKKTGTSVSKIFPWFETDSQSMAEKINSVVDPQECYT
jgi:xylulokinase